jgi:DNA mismatch repair protein MutS2
VEGSALAVGLLTDLLERGPRIVFTSHFPQVKTFALATPALDVAAFDVDPTTGAPRFTLVYHSVGQSLALPIARRHGLPPRAVAVAEALLAGESRDLARAVARLEESRRALDAEREAAEAERARLDAARAEAERLLADLRQRRRDGWRQDLEESRRLVRDVETRGRAILDELRRKPEPETLRRFVRDTAAELSARAADAAPPPAAATERPVPGDLVEVAGSSIRGELLEVTGERARIQRGGMRFEVPAAQLRRATGAAPRDRVAVTVERPAADTAELNVVGRRVRDAVAELDTFLDRAVRTGLSEVRIVHGIGTGALRRAIHDRLATSPYQPTWTEADPTGGGPGVTIVSLA